MNKLEDHNYSGIHATIIADSQRGGWRANRITTFLVTFPRIVLAEFNTHRALSRNSASSRAIPFEKMVKKVEDKPFIPIKWQKDHKGMQGTEYLNNKTGSVDEVKELWLEMRDTVVDKAIQLRGDGDEMLTKQLCNRPLETFLWHTAIVTATEWENFFALRAHPAAEIHIADLAEKMLEQYNLSDPNKLEAGGWHIPFGDNIDEGRVYDLAREKYPNVLEHGDEDLVQQIKIKIATARCARLSYFNFEGTDDYEKDVKLHDGLIKPGHWSPFEHCAQYMPEQLYKTGLVDGLLVLPEHLKGWSGNFKGFIQYRKMFQSENRADERVVKK